MAIPAYLSKNGVTVYPVTVPQAIIDPETGLPAQLGGADVEYTINNTHADENGNFTITGELVGAAAATHTHSISDITNLQSALDGKANTGHTHIMVTGIEVNGSTATGSVQLIGTGNVVINQNGADISIGITPYTTDMTATIMDGNTNSTPTGICVFTGTQNEWDTFKTTIEEGERYLVFIHS